MLSVFYPPVRAPSGANRKLPSLRQLKHFLCQEKLLAHFLNDARLRRWIGSFRQSAPPHYFRCAGIPDAGRQMRCDLLQGAVLAYDGSAMQQVDAKLLLDMAMSGTTATLLARRWQSALLVNVDDITLKNLMANKEAMDALMKIEEFRNLNDDIEVVINRSEKIKGLKEKAKNDGELSKEDKKTLSDEEKEQKSQRKQIQEKLIKFATRIPIFMYLSDYREHSLKDVIQELEPDLFTKVTGLSQADFSLLVSLNVFDEAVMNDAVYKFKRYEDASLEYAGIDKKEGYIGLYNTVIIKEP